MTPARGPTTVLTRLTKSSMHPSPAALRLESPPKRNRHQRERTGGKAVSMEVPCGAGPGMEKPRLPAPSGPPGPLPPFCGGDVGGPKSCPLTPGKLRRTSTPERRSQWARNQVLTPVWGQARHQLRGRPSRIAQRPAAVRTTAWQRRRSSMAPLRPRGVEATSAWGCGSQPLPLTPPEGGPGAPPVEHCRCRQPL